MGSTTTLEQYHLRWNDFQSSVAGALRDLRQAEHLLDVVLAVDGRLLRAHRLVLAACSPLFAHMLASPSLASGASPAVIMLHGLAFDHVAALLSFMYTGEVNVAHEDLAPFLAVAEELQVKGLSQKNSDAHSAEQNNCQGNEEEHNENQRKSTKPSFLRAKRKAGSSSYESESKKSLVMVTPDMPVNNDDDDSDDNEEDEESSSYNVDGRRAAAAAFGGLDYSLSEDHTRADTDFQDGVYSGHLWSSSSSGLDPGAEERAVCPFCQRELKNTHSLSVHISRYHSDNGSSNVEVTCPVCQRKYGNKYSLRTHMHLNHKDQLHLLPSAKRGRKSGGAGGGGNSNAAGAGASAAAATASNNPDSEQH